ncbi:MAG: hypothetical protein AB2770_19190, partial [Candidatus Thiodiazotropha taylori]
ALLVAHLEQPNFAPRALIGAFSGATGRIGFVLTGPNNVMVFTEAGLIPCLAIQAKYVCGKLPLPLCRLGDAQQGAKKVKQDSFVSGFHFHNG